MIILDLTGQKINHLLVIERVEDYISPRGKHIKQWLCLCDCQLEKPEDDRKYKLVPQGRLVSKKVQSCGCKNFVKNPKFVDLTNYQFGKWTAIKQVDKPENIKLRGTYWMCKCECGNERILRFSDIKRKNSLSCGQCSRNTYDISGDFGIGLTTKGEEFYFDLEDYEKIKNFTWCINTQGYVITWDSRIQKFAYMHRVVTGLSRNNKYVVDHINHINHDNRKEELRICTHAENSRNCKLSKNNTSGVTGVIWNSVICKWVAQIMVDYKYTSLDYFENFDDAVKCRKNAEKEFFGEYAFKEMKED